MTVWDVADGRRLHHLPHRALEIAACVDGRVALWDLTTGVQLGAWGDDRVSDLAWVEDDTLACATERGVVLLRV